MRVVFDASILGRAQVLPVARSGIFRYADNLLQALAASGECELSLTSFGYSLDAAGISDYIAQRETLKNCSTVLNPVIRLIGNSLRKGLRVSGKSATEQAVRSDPLRKFHQLGDGLLASIQQHYRSVLAGRLADAQIFHTPFLHIPPAMRSIPEVQRCVTVQDLNPIAHPEQFPPIVTRWSKKVMDNIGHDDWVITYSHYVKDDLCNQYRVDPNRVKVTPLAADSSLFHPCLDPEHLCSMRQRYGIPEGPYLLSLGSISPHKNIAHLVKCFARLVRQERNPDLNLVLAGTDGWMLDSLRDALGTTGDLTHRIVQTGFVRDEDQCALYGGATAFVFPSLREGFGLPPLEAMQCGTPVISANTTSLPEVIGTAGILVDPLDEDALCQSILDIYRNSDLRQRLIADGLERARQFSWQRCANATLDVYRDALATS